MKESEFIKIKEILEHLVFKEVKKQLPSLISEELKLAIESYTNDNRQIVKETNNTPNPTHNDGLKSSLRELFAGTPVMSPKIPEIKKQYSTDPMINQILNETVNDLRSKEHYKGPNVFQEGEISIQKSEIPTAIVNGNEIVVSVPAGVSALDVKEYAAPAVKNALTRNYSSFLKLVDQKRGKIA